VLGSMSKTHARRRKQKVPGLLSVKSRESEAGVKRIGVVERTAVGERVESLSPKRAILEKNIETD